MCDWRSNCEPGRVADEANSGFVTVNGMKQILLIALSALVGAAAGSIVRQRVVKRQTELVIAAHPIPVAAGVIAGLLSPKAKPIAALVVGLNVASNFPR